MFSVVRSVATFAAVGCLGLTLACGTDVSIAPFSTDERATTSATSGSGEGAHVVRLSVGESAALEVERRQYQRFMRYATDNPDVADVSAAGTIVGVSPGSATVRATFGDYTVVANVTVSATVYGNPEVPLFSIAPRAGAPLAVGASRQYWVYTDWSPSELASMGITYTATGGTITNMGVFTAGPVAGSFMVIAHCLCGLADTAVVTVSSTAAQLRELHISPKAVAMSAGAVQQFSASANWSTGNTTLPPLSYDASGGTVSAVGRYTAPSTPGTYRVIVSHVGGVLKDTAIVTVAGGGSTGTGGGDPIPTPPPSGGGGGPGNGIEPFFSDDFESGERTSANGFAWTTGGKVHVREDKPHTGNFSLKFRFGPDPIGADSESEQRFNLGRDMPELWVEYYLYIPDNFEMRPGAPGNNKFFFLWATRYSKTGDQQVGVEFERRGQGTATARILSMSENYLVKGTEWTVRTSAFMNPDFMTSAKAGTWQRIRIHYKSSSASQMLDGVFEGWMGDELMWRSSRWSFWYEGGNNYVRQGYLMGWSNSGYTEETSFYIDDVKFYDRNPGWR